MKPEACQYRPQVKLITNFKKYSYLKNGYGSAATLLGLLC
jgi:hypothetical protein